MSGAITATVAAVVGVGSLLYTAEENRKNKSEADEKLKIQKQADANERAFMDKKKQNNDMLAANNSLRLRGAGGVNGMNIDPGLIAQGTGGVGGGAGGGLGGASDQQIATSIANYNKTNSILGRF